MAIKMLEVTNRRLEDENANDDKDVWGSPQCGGTRRSPPRLFGKPAKRNDVVREYFQTVFNGELEKEFPEFDSTQERMLMT